MDEDERCFYYKGFLLMCDPTPLESGGFQARAVIHRQSGDALTVFSESPPGVHVISEAAAVEYAKSWAISWVDSYVDG